MTHGVHCSCQRFPLPHRNEPISAPCAYTRRRLSPLHVSATCPLVCADRKDVAFDYLWDSQFTKLKLLLLHPTIIFVFRKGLQRGTIWIDFRQIIVTMQFFTNRWGKECKVYGCKMTDSSSWMWNKGSHNHHRVWIPDLYWRRFLRSCLPYSFLVKHSRRFLTYWQTRRSSSKLLWYASYFQLSFRYLEMW